MPEYLRVRQKGEPGHKITVRADRFDADSMVKLDENPLGRDGLPAAPTYRTTVNKAAEKKKATPSGQQADTRKDED